MKIDAYISHFIYLSIFSSDWLILSDESITGSMNEEVNDAENDEYSLHLNVMTIIIRQIGTLNEDT